MCSSKECPKRNECYRARAIPNDWQSYCDFFKGSANKKCGYFMKIEKNDKVKPSYNLPEQDSHPRDLPDDGRALTKF